MKPESLRWMLLVRASQTLGEAAEDPSGASLRGGGCKARHATHTEECICTALDVSHLHMDSPPNLYAEFLGNRLVNKIGKPNSDGIFAMRSFGMPAGCGNKLVAYGGV